MDILTINELMQLTREELCGLSARVEWILIAFAQRAHTWRNWATRRHALARSGRTWRTWSAARRAPSSRARPACPHRQARGRRYGFRRPRRNRSFDMRRPKFAPPGDRFSVRTDQPLSDVEAAAVSLRKTQHDRDPVVARRLRDFPRERAVATERIVEVTLDESLRDRPGRRSDPDVPRVAGYPGLGKRDKLCALLRRFFDIQESEQCRRYRPAGRAEAASGRRRSG
jgi:hypothetical protein